MNRKGTYVLAFIGYVVLLVLLFAVVLKDALSVRGAWFYYCFPLAMAGLLALMLSKPFRHLWS